MARHRGRFVRTGVRTVRLYKAAQLMPVRNSRRPQAEQAHCQGVLVARSAQRAEAAGAQPS